jgi:hypothetical protein
MLKISGFVVDVRGPLQSLNTYGAPGVAVTVTGVPAGIQGPTGLEDTVPAPVGFSWRVSWYSVIQFHVIVENCVIVKFVEVPVPEAGTSPVPVQPVHTYRLPAGPEAGEVTLAVTDVP